MSPAAGVLGPRPEIPSEPATPVVLLRYLRRQMERESHHGRVGIPVSVNVDDWIAQLEVIIIAAMSSDDSHDPDRNQRVKAAFVEGYNAMRHQYHLSDDSESAWEQSISKQGLDV